MTLIRLVLTGSILLLCAHQRTSSHPEDDQAHRGGRFEPMRPHEAVGKYYRYDDSVPRRFAEDQRHKLNGYELGRGKRYEPTRPLSANRVFEDGLRGHHEVEWQRPGQHRPIQRVGSIYDEYNRYSSHVSEYRRHNVLRADGEGGWKLGKKVLGLGKIVFIPVKLVFQIAKFAVSRDSLKALSLYGRTAI